MRLQFLRKHATSLVLVAAALGLGGYMLAVDRGSPTSSETQARKDNLLPVLRREELSEIDLEQGGSQLQLIRLRDDAGQDQYVSRLPGQSKDEPADSVAVDQLLQALEFANKLRAVESSVDRKTMGLDAPRARVTLKMGKLTYQVTIGAESKSPPGSTYVELAGQGTFVVAEGLAKQVLRPLDSYRSRTVVPYGVADLRQIEFKGEGEPKLFVRAPWGGFRLRQGNADGPRVSHPTFTRAMGALASASAERFLTLEQANDALQKAPSRIQIALTPKDASRPTAQLELGGDCPVASSKGALAGADDATPKLTVMVRKEPGFVAACVPRSVLQDLSVPRQAYIDRRLLDMQPDEVEEVKLERDGKLLEIARKGGGWHVRHPSESDIDAQEGSGFVQGLLDLEGELVAEPDLKKAGLEPPSGTLVVQQPANNNEPVPEQRLELGTQSPDGILIKRTQDGAVLHLSGNALRLLQPTTTLLRSSQLLNLSPDRLRRVEIDGPDGKLQVIERTSSGFALQFPAGYAVDAPLAADLFETLAKLKAERWLADRDDGSFGFAHPQLIVRFDAQEDGPVKAYKLLLGSAASDGVYARWEPDTGVFVLSRTTERTLRAYAIDRSAFMVDPNELTAVRFETPARTVLVQCAGEEWEVDPKSPAKLSESDLNKVQQALIEMRAEGVVHLGDAKAEEGFKTPLIRIQVQRKPEQGVRSTPVMLSIGQGDVWQTTNIYYARREGVPATFAIAAAKVRPLLEALGQMAP